MDARTPMRRDAPRPDTATPVHQAGFTLVEVLVTLSLISLMAVLITSFLGQLGNVNSRQESIVHQQEVNAAARHVERTLETALALPIDLNDNDKRHFFKGGNSSMTFVTESRFGLSEATTRTVWIGLADDNSERRLVQKNRRRRFSDNSDPAYPLEAEILRSVTRFDLEYLGSDERGKLVWTDGWTSQRQLPLAVRFRLEFERNDQIFEASGTARLAAS